MQRMNESKALVQLKKSPLKVTKPRVDVLRVLVKSAKPMSAEDVFSALKGVNKVTVYRNLNALCQHGIIHQVDLRKPSTYFEYPGDHHHHIVCTECGRVENFTDCNIEGIMERVLKHSKYFKHLCDHSLELFGKCNVCLQKKS